VVVLVPITLGAPAVLVLVPPPMPLAPATLSSGVQFTAFVVRLGAVASMLLDGFVKIMLGSGDPALAVVVVFSVNPWDCGEQQSSCHYGS